MSPALFRAEATKPFKGVRNITLSDVKITRIDSGKIEFDEILGFTSDTNMATICYLRNGKQRTISIESEAVQIEANV